MQLQIKKLRRKVVGAGPVSFFGSGSWPGEFHGSGSSANLLSSLLLAEPISWIGLTLAS